jgi:AAA+ superfamily predicted ATPase
MGSGNILFGKWADFIRYLLRDLLETANNSGGEWQISEYKTSENLKRFEELSNLMLCLDDGLKSIFELFHLNDFERFCLVLGCLFCEDFFARELILQLHGDFENGLLLSFCQTIFCVGFSVTGNIQVEPLRMRLLGLEWRSGVEVFFPNVLVRNFIKGVNCLEASVPGLLLLDLRSTKQHWFASSAQGKLKDYLTKIQGLKTGKHLLVLRGGKLVGKRTTIALAAKENGVAVLLVDLSIFEGVDAEQIKRLACDVCLLVVLNDAWLCFENLGADSEAKKVFGFFVNAVKRYVSFFCLLTSERLDASEFIGSYTLFELSWGCLQGKENILCWRYFLDKYDVRFKGSDLVARRFRFVVGQIEQVVKRIKLLDNPETSQILKICHEVSGENFKDKAKRLEGLFTWDDLVVTEDCEEALRTICDLVKFENIVYEDLGFERRMAYGRSVSALFFGVSGTGKTMAAQVVANEIGLPLYRVDLSQVISKYVGETEKSLNDIFDIAKKSNVVLFFDEADALFAKRTQVANSNDRFANVETSFLLQKVEDYSGVVILASNLLVNFDEAFKRRIKVMVQFALPDEEMRLRLWVRVFPEQVDTAQLDMQYLAEKFEVSGSMIKSAALLATFFATREKSPLTMDHVLNALKNEMSKSGQLVLDTDFGL